MKKLISIFVTLLFFASVTVFTLPMMQNDANADLSLTEKVTIMANAGDGNGDEEGYVCFQHYQGTWIGGWHRYLCDTCELVRMKDWEYQDTCEKD